MVARDEDYMGHDWQHDIRRMLDSLIVEYELPERSLYLSDNLSQKDASKIISHSVCIWEPDYPEYLKRGEGRIKSFLPSYRTQLKADQMN